MSWDVEAQTCDVFPTGVPSPTPGWRRDYDSKLTPVVAECFFVTKVMKWWLCNLGATLPRCQATISGCLDLISRAQTSVPRSFPESLSHTKASARENNEIFPRIFGEFLVNLWLTFQTNLGQASDSYKIWKVSRRLWGQQWRNLIDASGIPGSAVGSRVAVDSFRWRFRSFMSSCNPDCWILFAPQTNSENSRPWLAREHTDLTVALSEVYTVCPESLEVENRQACR